MNLTKLLCKIGIHKYRPDSCKLTYTKECPEEWINEGIDPGVMDLFDVRIDHKSNV